MYAIHYLTHLTAKLACFIVGGASTEEQAVESFRRLLPNAEIVAIECQVIEPMPTDESRIVCMF